MDSLAKKEMEILHELRKLLKKPMLQITAILEWSAGRLAIEEGTVIRHLPESGVYVRTEE